MVTSPYADLSLSLSVNTLALLPFRDWAGVPGLATIYALICSNIQKHSHTYTLVASEPHGYIPTPSPYSL